MNNQTIRHCKHLIRVAARSRNITRLKYVTQKFDDQILNGQRIEFAYTRLFILSPLLISAVSKSDKREVALAISKIKTCLQDCNIIAKLKPLLPDDIVLRDYFINLVMSTNKTLLNTGKKK